MADGGFDPTEMKNLAEGLNKDFSQFREKNNERLAGIEKKFDDVVTNEHVERINEAIQQKQEQLDRIEASLKRKATKVVNEAGEEIDLDQKAQSWANEIGTLRQAVPEKLSYDGLKEYRAAFDALIRKNGDVALLSDMQRKALSVGSDQDGGYLVHPDMSGRMVGFIYETSPMRQYASVQSISTDALEGMFDLDQAGYGWVEETEARAATTTPQLKKWRIPVHEMYAFPQATQKMLDDAGANIEAWMTQKISDRFARAEAASFISGTGVGQPRGFLTYSDWSSAGTYTHGAIEQFDTGVNGAFDTNANGGSDVLLEAIYGMKAQYRARAIWAMNRTTTKLVRTLRDGDGNYLWAPGLVSGQPASLLGYSVASFEDMPNPGTGSLSIAFGDFREGYQIVDRIGVRILRDLYTNKPYVGLYATRRVGGDVVNFDAIKLIAFQA